MMPHKHEALVDFCYTLYLFGIADVDWISKVMAGQYSLWSK